MNAPTVPHQQPGQGIAGTGRGNNKTNPRWRESNLGEFVNERQHFTKFKRAHKRMAVVQHIGRPSLTTPRNGDEPEKDLQDSLHLPKRLPLRIWLRDRLRAWSYLVVKRAEDGHYSISKGVAALFISAFLSVAIMAGLGLLWQRDEIVRLRTIQEMQEKTNADILSKVDQARNYATIADKNAARLEGKFDQFSLQYGIKNADKNQNGQ